MPVEDGGGQVALPRDPLDFARMSPAGFARVVSDGRWTMARHLKLLNLELLKLAGGHTKRLIISTPPRHGKPLDVNVRVLMGDGSRKALGLVEKGDSVISRWGRSCPVTAVHEQGLVQSIRIETESRRSVVAGLEHPFLTPNGWVKAGDLGVGRELIRLRDGEVLESRLLDLYLQDRIVAIEPAGSVESRCLTVQDDASFVANDFVVHNSELISRYFPAWYLGNFPENKIILCSYEAHFAASWGRKARELLEQVGGQVFGVNVSGKSQAADWWEIENHQGAMYTAGVGGPITGKGSQCVPGYTDVATEVGPMRMDDLVRMPAKPRVLSFNHATGQPEWRSIVATRISFSSELVDIRTVGGRRLRCTPEHRVYGLQRGYRQARDFGERDSLLSIPVEQDVSPVREGEERQGSCLSAVLLPASGSRGDSCLSKVWEGLYPGESCRPLRVLSHHPPQVSADPISVVERIRTKRQPVYDIQVEGNRNFFAAGVLVSNCLLIDDPVKNEQEALSMVSRDRAWDWWQTTASTRLEPGGVVCLVMTRWSEDDLAGRLIENEKDAWKVIRLPCFADEEDDPLGRAIGDPLWPERWPRHEIEAKTLGMSTHWFNALYQGRPTPPEGLLFKRDHFRYFSIVTLSDGSKIYEIKDAAGAVSRVLAEKDLVSRYAVMDLAVSMKTRSDFTVAGVFGLSSSGDLLLLDLVRARVEGPDQVPLVQRIFRDWSPAFVGIEATAYQLALIQELRRLGLPIRELRPDRDKFARAVMAATRMEGGQVLFLAGAPWLRELENELLTFPHAPHDDCVDVIGYGCLAQQMAGGVRIRIVA